jgi:hypothetical protein
MRDRLCQFVLGEPAADGYERAQIVRCSFDGRVVAQNPNRERIVENLWIVDKLMRRATHRHAEGGFAG